MSADAAVDAVLFDYGGVLTGPVRHSIEAWIREDAIEPASFSRTLKGWLSRDAGEGTPIHLLETGDLDVAEFERLFADALSTTDGRSVVAEGILGRLFADMRPDPAMFAVVEELRAHGVQLGLLSNSWGNTYPREQIDTLMDVVVISGEVGLRKPHRAIYELAVARLGTTPGRALFVDDAKPNVVGAQAAGLQALLHVDPSSTRTAIAGLVPALHLLPTGEDS